MNKNKSPFLLMIAVLALAIIGMLLTKDTFSLIVLGTMAAYMSWFTAKVLKEVGSPGL